MLYTETSSYVKIYLHTMTSCKSKNCIERHVSLQLTSLTVRVRRINLFGHGFVCQSRVFRRICKLKSHVVQRRFDYNIAKLGEKYGVIY